MMKVTGYKSLNGHIYETKEKCAVADLIGIANGNINEAGARFIVEKRAELVALLRSFDAPEALSGEDGE